MVVAQYYNMMIIGHKGYPVGDLDFYCLETNNASVQDDNGNVLIRTNRNNNKYEYKDYHSSGRRSNESRNSSASRKTRISHSKNNPRNGIMHHDHVRFMSSLETLQSFDHFLCVKTFLDLFACPCKFRRVCVVFYS